MNVRPRSSVITNCAALRSKPTVVVALIAALLMASPGSFAQQSAPASPPPPAETGEASESAPLERGVEENVEVALAEFKVLITNKRGEPMLDLKPEEIEVLEGGKVQKLAFIESVKSAAFTASIRDLTPRASPTYTADGATVRTDESLVLPPPAQRRVIFAFDQRNSKLRARDDWQQAALQWVRDEMRPQDRVGIIILRNTPEWIVEYTNDQSLLLHTLETISIEAGAPDRDRSQEMTELMASVRGNCESLGRANGRRSNAERQRQNAQIDSEVAATCGANVAQDFVQEWDRSGNETVDSLRTLVGQLAAIPGQKMVLLFSDGWVPDSGELATSALASVFGVGVISLSRQTLQYQKDVLREMNRLHKVAKAANVAFFTLDTRSGSDFGFSGDLESAQARNQNSMGINPWSEVRHNTEGALTALAKESGGRSFKGPKNLVDKVTTAANSFFGYYSVGYYRSDPSKPAGRVKVKIKRRGSLITYPDRPDFFPHRSQAIEMDLIVGKPTRVDQDTQALPISLQLPFDSLPLRRAGTGSGVQLGAFIQAVTPDGTIARERLDVAEVFVNRADRREAKGKLYMHQTNLVLPEGAFRVHVRLSDDRQSVVAQQAIDLTLGDGTVLGGLAGLGKAKGDAAPKESPKAPVEEQPGS